MKGKEAEPNLSKSASRSSRWMSTLFIVAASAFVVWTFAPQTIGEQVRRHLQSTLQQHYPDFQVTIGRGRFDPKVGLILENISVKEPASNPSDLVSSGLAMLGSQGKDILKAKRVVVFADARPKRLLDKSIPMVTQRVVLEGVEITTKLDPSGKLSIEKLWPPPRFGSEKCPRLEIRDATLVLQTDQPDGMPLKLHVDSLVALDHSKTIAPAQNANSSDPNAINQPAMVKTISASGSSDFADSFSVQVTGLEDGAADVQANITGIRLNNRLLAKLPARFQELLSDASGLSVAADCTLSARYRPGQPIDFHARSKIREASFDHPKLPLPLARMGGVVSFDPSGITVESLQGLWGDARYHVRGKVHGFAWPCPAELNCSVTNLLLDSRVAQILPQRLRTNWDKFQPHGRIDVQRARLIHHAGQWSSAATVTCKGVDVRFEKFPYPVQQLVGDIRLQNHVVSSQFLSARVGGQSMQCVFSVPTRPNLGIEKRVTIGVDGPIAIDNVMVASLTARREPTSKLESFVRSLNPRGSIHVQRATLGHDRDGVPYQEMDIRVSDGTIRYDKFSYPIYNVQGDIQVRGDLVEIEGFRGVNAHGGQIHCAGSYRIPPKNGSMAQPRFPNAGNLPVNVAANPHGRQSEPSDPQGLQLAFHAVDVPMDGSLRSSLPESSQRTWDALSPSGVLDELDVKITQAPVDPFTGKLPPVEMNVTAREKESGSLSNHALRMQPTTLPYRLDITDGVVHFDGKKVMIHSLRAQHDQSRLSAEGSCLQQPDGRWRLSIDLHSGSRINPDAELIEALPVQLREAMRELQLRGLIGVRGSTSTLFSDRDNVEPVFDWNLELQLEGNRIGDVGPVHAIRGGMSVRGRKNETGIRAEGQVRIDSMHINDLQVTNIVGPYSVSDDILKLGSNVGRGMQPIQGRLFGGLMSLHGDAILSNASFDVGISLAEAKVPVLLAELGQGNSDLKGTLNGSVELEGILGTTELLSGAGSVTVDGANLYQLPLLVQVLNLFSINPTEDVAFTNADAKFTLSENNLTLHDLKLWGSLIALQGSGTLDRRQELDLTFNTRVSPRNGFTQILRPLGSSRYTLWTVDVRGPLSEPTVNRRALDGVGRTIERWIPGMQKSSSEKWSEQRDAPVSGIQRMIR